ncbi:MAG TPA: stage II sporulation protein R [Syntrophomonadaceae bacterium]|nr:stage II sporulation protein R [Syntrophomonadaceae bacterium]
MRSRAVLILVVGLLLLGLILQTGENNRARKASTYHNLLRFHVIANSDHRRDQEAKYLVRDALVSFLKPQLEKAAGYNEAREIVLENRRQIASIARETLDNAGFKYPVRVLIGRFTFPARAYGNIVLPAGGYEAVRVVLGEGKGANWWCVLFPPLCFVDISSTNVGMSDSGKGIQEVVAGEQLHRIENIENKEESGWPGPVHFRFRVLDWLRNESGHLARIINS